MFLWSKSADPPNFQTGKLANWQTWCKVWIVACRKTGGRDLSGKTEAGIGDNLRWSAAYLAQYALPKAHTTLLLLLLLLLLSYLESRPVCITLIPSNSNRLSTLDSCIVAVIQTSCSTYSRLCRTTCFFAALHVIFRAVHKLYLSAIRFALRPISTRIGQWCWIGEMMKWWLWRNCPASSPELMILEKVRF